MNNGRMLLLVRDLAQDTKNVLLSVHARKRMRERAITTTQVYECLRRGDIDEPAHQNIRGCWCCKLRRVHAGDLVRVVVEIRSREGGQKLLVITVY